MRSVPRLDVAKSTSRVTALGSYLWLRGVQQATFTRNWAVLATGFTSADLLWK